MPLWWWARCRCWIAVSVIWCCRGGLVLGWGRRWGWRRSCWLRRWPPTPDAVAVIDGARQVSYRELDEWSTRLARVLIEAGVGPERAVGVAMDRCVELVVAWWAVVKAGGVYVPVDRAHPVERIAAVLDAVGAVCVLTCGADTVAGAAARPVLRIDV